MLDHSCNIDGHISQHDAIELVLARSDMRAILTRLSDYELANIDCRARAYAEAGIPLTAQFDYDAAATRAEQTRRGS
jgi:hypothetical protein